MPKRGKQQAAIVARRRPIRAPADAKRIAYCRLKSNVKSDDSGVPRAHMKMSLPRSTKSRWTKHGSCKAVRASKMITFPASAVTARHTVGSALVVEGLRAILIQDGGKSQCPCVTRRARQVGGLEHPRLASLGYRGIDNNASHADQMRAVWLGWAQGTFACAMEVNDDQMQVQGDPRQSAHARN